jgi:hypothetical protein
MSFLRVLRGSLLGIRTTLEDVVPVNGPKLAITLTRDPKNDLERFVAQDKNVELLEESVVDVTRKKSSEMGRKLISIPRWLKWTIFSFTVVILLTIVLPFLTVVVLMVKSTFGDENEEGRKPKLPGSDQATVLIVFGLMIGIGILLALFTL